jgi:ArsR family transcriptional regulator
MPAALAAAASLTKALGHRGRLRILAVLAQGETSVCQLAAATRMPVSTTSGLLLELRRAGLVREQRRGKWVFYSIAEEGLGREILDVVLGPLSDDPQVRRDTHAAARLRAKSPAAACTAVGLPQGPEEQR